MAAIGCDVTNLSRLFRQRFQHVNTLPASVSHGHSTVGLVTLVKHVVASSFAATARTASIHIHDDEWLIVAAEKESPALAQCDSMRQSDAVWKSIRRRTGPHLNSPARARQTCLVFSPIASSRRLQLGDRVFATLAGHGRRATRGSGWGFPPARFHESCRSTGDTKKTRPLSRPGPR
jgi:hypothetical protein